MIYDIDAFQNELLEVSWEIIENCTDVNHMVQVEQWCILKINIITESFNAIP